MSSPNLNPGNSLDIRFAFVWIQALSFVLRAEVNHARYLEGMGGEGDWLCAKMAAALPEASEEEERTTWPTAACLSVPPTSYKRLHTLLPSVSEFHFLYFKVHKSILLSISVPSLHFVQIFSILSFDQTDVGVQLWYLAHFGIALHLQCSLLLCFWFNINQSHSLFLLTVDVSITQVKNISIHREFFPCFFSPYSFERIDLLNARV